MKSFRQTMLAMGKYDTSWGQDTASPFIMENDKLMAGWRPNPDSGSSALD